MKFDPYPFQQTAIDHAAAFLKAAEPGTRQLYAAPTGCGKSIVELKVQEQFDDLWIVTPRDEIVQGMLDKLGAPEGSDMLDYRISTPVRLRNRLMSGALAHPGKLVFDEGHHHEAETWQQLDLLTGFAPCIAYTATPYRGSPRSTKAFLERWGEPLWLITFEEAAREGYITVPQFTVLPLVDDDVVEISGGEFTIESIDSATVDRLGDMAEHAKQWYNKAWDLPTVFAMPSSATCFRMREELLKRGLPAVTVSASTPKDERKLAFQATANSITALLHINIVSEGVDFPFRRLVDLCPTMSPVRWVQQLGRITRPTKTEQPVYVCTNRNLMRHAYALEGSVPTYALAESEKLFGVTKRAHSRALGLEALGRFKPTDVKLTSGVHAYVYALSVPVGAAVVEYCVIVHPTMDAIWATKINVKQEDGTKTWGTWRACDAPESVQGFSSVGQKQISEKQANWWKRSASRFGLDASQEVTRKNFQALPVLSDLGLRLR